MTDAPDPFRFLLVDDDRLSIMAMQRALRKLHISNETLVARDGQEALDALDAAREKNGGTLPPFIVILDMNMPRMNGLEFLDAVDGKPALQDLVIFVFETLGLTRDTSLGDRRNVAGLLSKDAPLESLSQALDQSGCRAHLAEARM